MPWKILEGGITCSASSSLGPETNVLPHPSHSLNSLEMRNPTSLVRGSLVNSLRRAPGSCISKTTVLTPPGAGLRTRRPIHAGTLQHGPSRCAPARPRRLGRRSHARHGGGCFWGGASDLILILQPHPSLISEMCSNKRESEGT